MDPERWRRVEFLYHSALELDPARRNAFLEEACAGDMDLFEEVASLLSLPKSDITYLEAPALQAVARAIAQDQIRRSAPGAMIGHYRIVEWLGSGGMGDVYKAEDTTLGRLVALKFLHCGPGIDALMQERFIREARTASLLNHPNICSIYSIDEFEGDPFIAMELLEGQSLGERIKEGPLRTDELLDYAIQMADGLDAAHARGIIHRDLKPANLFLVSGGRLKLLDFGAAKWQHLQRSATDLPASEPRLETASLTQSGVLIGTVAYMSPEQARGEELDVRTDLFSLGAVLYEMATGQAAFAGATVAVVFNAILNQKPAPVSTLRPGFPPKFEEIINHTLERDRETRYQQAADLRADLRRLKRELDRAVTGTAEVSPPIEAGTKPSRLGRWVAWTVAALVAAAGVVGVSWKWQSRPPARSVISEISPLNGLPGMASHPSLRPDGSQIAFAWDGYQHKNSHIYVQPASSGSAEPLAITGGDDASDVSPAWSPDGMQVAFIRISQKPGESGVYVAPSSGGRERLVLLSHPARPATGLSRQLAWCKDGSLLLSDHDAEAEPIPRVSHRPWRAQGHYRSSGGIGRRRRPRLLAGCVPAGVRTDRKKPVRTRRVCRSAAVPRSIQKGRGCAFRHPGAGLAGCAAADLFFHARRFFGLVDGRHQER